MGGLPRTALLQEQGIWIVYGSAALSGMSVQDEIADGNGNKAQNLQTDDSCDDPLRQNPEYLENSFQTIRLTGNFEEGIIA